MKKLILFTALLLCSSSVVANHPSYLASAAKSAANGVMGFWEHYGTGN